MPRYTIQQYCELLGKKVGEHEKVSKVVEERLNALENGRSEENSQKDEIVSLLSQVGELNSMVKDLQEQINELKTGKQDVQMDIDADDDGDDDVDSDDVDSNDHMPGCLDE